MSRNIGNPNHTFKYNTQDLLKTLIKNREIHKNKYDEAMIEYKGVLKDELTGRIVELETLVGDIDDGREILHHIDNLKTVKPTQYLSEYDRFISMFEMMTENVIELDSETFNQLVRDEWEWKHSFDNSTMLYNVG